ncbi:sulfite exporter TauE/SafE family protein [Candidatus Bathyarchaeota archaeon]|nr:MAG: sulfite exporter TauE/SafE family protein [Candidatus Bathyarchaeota archaeon]
MLDLILLPILAFFIGIIAAMLGIGGGVFMVPALVLFPWYNLNPAVASGTSLAAIVFTSLSSTFRYRKQRRIDYLLGLTFASTTIPGAFLGSYIKSIIQTWILGLIFAIFLIFVSIRMFIGKRGDSKSDASISRKGGKKRRIIDSYGKIFTYSANFWAAPFLGLAAGFCSGLLGIGGGAVLVPAMNMGLGIPIHIAVATSMFIMIFTSISGTLTNIWLNQIRFDYAILLAVGIIFGAQFGAHYAAKVSAKNLRKMFAVVLLIASVRMILKFTGVMP